MRQKGAAIRGTLHALAAVYGDDALAQVKAAMHPEVRQQIEPLVLATSWYAIEISAGVHAAIRDVLGDGSWNISHALGVEAARSDFTGVYRAFMQSLTYDDVWERSQRTWDHYNSQGKAAWYELDDGHARGVIDGVTGFNEGIWNAVAGRMQALLSLLGAQKAVVAATRVSSTGCRMEASWRA